MTVEKFGVKPREHIPSAVVHHYLTDFAKTFDIWRRIRFSTKVEEVVEGEKGQWIITVATTQTSDGKKSVETKKLVADKLVLATGVTGNPNMPQIEGADTFDAPMFHCKEFLQKKDLLLTSKKVVVYGGSKSGVRTDHLFYTFSPRDLLRAIYTPAYLNHIHHIFQ